MSSPPATSWVGERNFAVFKLVTRPPLFGCVDVARRSPDMFQTRNKPS